MEEDAIYNKHLDVFLVWACRETGVIDALLDGPKRAKAVAAETGITERAAAIALEGLRDGEYVERSGEEYRPTPELTAFDPDTDPLDRGILPHRLDSLAKYTQLPETMQTGDPPGRTEEGFHNYIGAMATIDEAEVREIVTAVEHCHPRPDSVLDVGGGPGRFSAEFRRRGADVTLFDQPAVLDMLADRHEQAGLDVVAGNAQESLPEGFDLVFSARMTSGFTPEDIQTYFENAYAAVEPGGTFAAIERVRGRSEVAERFAVHMLAVFPTGNTYEASTYREALTRAGFVDAEIDEVPGTEYQAIVGRKPE
jgi:SAM-dependent methyltransferase